MADNQGALPTDNTDPTQNATAPGPQWGQSLSQDISNIGGAIGQGAQAATAAMGPENPSGEAAGAAGQGAGITAYIMHTGAMPNDQYQALRDQIEKSGINDPNDVTAHAIVQGGPPALMAAGHNWDAGRGAVQKAIDDGNYELAATEGNKALTQVPDGTKAFVTLNNKTDTFNMTVHTPKGDAQHYKLNPDEYTAIFAGQGGTFDHVAGKGVNGVIDQIIRATHPEGAFGGPPKDYSQPGNQAKPPEGEQAAIGELDKSAPTSTAAQRAQFQTYGPSQEQQEGPPEKPTPVAPRGTPEPGPAIQGEPGTAIPENPRGAPMRGFSATERIPGGGPGNLPAYDPRADDPNVKMPYSDWIKMQNTRNSVLNRVPSGLSPQQNAANWALDHGQKPSEGAVPTSGMEGAPWQRQATFTNPDQKTEAEINAPVRVINRGLKPENAGNIPLNTFEPGKIQNQRGAYDMGRESPGRTLNERNNPAITNQSRENIATNQNQSRENIAAGQNQSRQNVANTQTQGRLQEAQIKANQLANNSTDTTERENARTAGQIVGNVMKNGGTFGDAIGQMVEQKMNPRILNALIARPSEQATPQAPQQQQQRPQQPQQPQQPQSAQPPNIAAVSNGPVQTEPTATNQQTGEKMVYRGGKWTPLQ